MVLADGHSPSLRIGRSQFPIVLPSLRDSRLHVAFVVVTLHLLGQLVLDFGVSVPQILAAILSCAVVDMVVVFHQSRNIVWPASAMLTGSGVALILRDATTEAGEHWTFRNTWLFAAVALLSLASKYLIRRNGSHVFNPSNLGLVVAFIVLGSSRVEPLDLWWGPFSVWMLLAYGVILAGGLLVNRRLGLLELAFTFWIVFMICMASLSAAGHCIVAPWSIRPVCDGRFLWVMVTSPEILVFLFFMITDPKTVPAGRWARIAFGAGVAVVSSLLIAPQTTEFGAKVGLLAGLVLMCAARPVVATLISRFGQPTVTRAGWRGTLALTLLMAPLVVAAAGQSSRTAGEVTGADALVHPAAIVPEVDPARVPVVTAAPEVAAFDEELTLREGSRALGIELLRGLDVEALAIEQRDPELLRSVDHGGRLYEMRSLVDGPEPRVLSDYRFDRMHLDIAEIGGQTGSRLIVEGQGTLMKTVLDEDGEIVDRSSEPFARTFVLLAGDDGRWFIAQVDAPLEE